MNLDEFNKSIAKSAAKITQNLRDMAGTKTSVPYDELFTDSFIGQNTNFQTFQEMKLQGGINDSEDFTKPEWGTFITAQTKFTSWDDMLKTAGLEWTARKLQE